MSDAMTIHLDMDPPRVTAQMKGVNFRTGRFYEKPEVARARRDLTYELYKQRPKTPYDGAVAVNVTWMYANKDKRKHLRPKTTRPDLDNAVKLLLDVMTTVGFWDDDAQVVELSMRKYWSLQGAIKIEIKPVRG